MSHDATLRVPPPDDATLIDRIRAFIAEAVDRPLEDVGPETDIYRELAIDSLGVTAVFIDMAYHFGIKEPPASTDFSRLNTARSLASYVRAESASAKHV